MSDYTPTTEEVRDQYAVPEQHGWHDSETTPTESKGGRWSSND